MAYKEYYCCPNCGIIDRIWIKGNINKVFNDLYQHGEIVDSDTFDEYIYYEEIGCEICGDLIYEFPDESYDYVPESLAVIVKNNEFIIGNDFRKLFMEYLNQYGIKYEIDNLDDLIIEEILKFESD